MGRRRGDGAGDDDSLLADENAVKEAIAANAAPKSSTSQNKNRRVKEQQKLLRFHLRRNGGYGGRSGTDGAQELLQKEAEWCAPSRLRLWSVAVALALLIASTLPALGMDLSSKGLKMTETAAKALAARAATADAEQTPLWLEAVAVVIALAVVAAVVR